MLRGGAGAGSLRRRSHSAAGGRARSAAGARRPELELPGVSLPLRPLRARQPKPARELREAASQPPTRTAVTGAWSPARGSPRRGASLAGTRASHGHCRDTSQAARYGRGVGSGRARQRPGQGGCGCSSRSARGSGRLGFPVLWVPGAGSEEGGWGRNPAAGPAVQAGAQTDAFKLAGNGIEGLRAAAESAPRAIPAGPWFP